MVSVLYPMRNREEGELRGTRLKMEASDSGGCVGDEMRGEELDFTERLPDDLLVKFLSGFTLKEAARTSIVSRRWRNLWKSAHLLVLDFDAMQEAIDIYRRDPDPTPAREELILEKRRRYIKWVNEVVRHLQQHNNSNASKFRIAFDYNKGCNSEGDIDRWLLFALSKRVESLDLSFDFRGVIRNEYYFFSEDCCNHIKTPVGLSEIKFLRSLRLLNVHVTKDILEHFIANCPSLEELAVQRTDSLIRLRVVGSSRFPLRLKHLEIRLCLCLEYLEIDHAPYLVRFIYGNCHRMKEIRVGNCPRLVDLGLIYRLPTPQFSLFVGSFLGCASQLQSLFFQISSATHLLVTTQDVAEYTHLEQLTVEVNSEGRQSLLGLASLINLCPRLYTLQVLLCIGTGESLSPPPNLVKTCRRSVKVVKIVGFNGYPEECEFIEYMMDYFVCLERILIDCNRSDPVLVNDVTLFRKARGKPSLTEEQARKAKEAASRFKSRAPPTLEFVVI